MTLSHQPARLAAVILPAAIAVLTLAVLPPLPQPLSYHGFADTRTLFGVGNFADVASNLPFLLVGVLGVTFLLDDRRAGRVFAEPAEKWPYLVFFAGVALTSIGSTYYHLAPDNPRLSWDRLPMTVAFMSLLAATVADRVSARGGSRALLPLLLVGIATVAWWRVSARLGMEDLGPYLALQFGSIATVMLTAVLFPSRYARGRDIYAVFVLYALAKVAEGLDGWLFSLGGLLSGHSLKHLLSALAALWVLRMLVLRAGIPADTGADS